MQYLQALSAFFFVNIRTQVTNYYDIFVLAKNTYYFMKGDDFMIIEYCQKEEQNKTWQEKVDDLKKKLKTSVTESVNWCEQHKELVIIAAPVLGMAVKTTYRYMTKTAAYRAEDKRRNLEVWDPVNGFRWKLRRKMTNSEKFILDLRHKNGESIGIILDDMKLLK